MTSQFLCDVKNCGRLAEWYSTDGIKLCDSHRRSSFQSPNIVKYAEAGVPFYQGRNMYRKQNREKRIFSKCRNCAHDLSYSILHGKWLHQGEELVCSKMNRDFPFDTECECRAPEPNIEGARASNIL